MSLKFRTLKATTRISALFALLACTAAQADNVVGKDRILCSTSSIMLCFEDGMCLPVSVLDIDTPQFLIIDTKRKTISTTEASGEKRESKIANMTEDGVRTFLQGIENDRAYSILIEEDLGRFSAAVARDGIVLSVFGACTDADVD